MESFVLIAYTNLAIYKYTNTENLFERYDMYNLVVSSVKPRKNNFF